MKATLAEEKSNEINSTRVQAREALENEAGLSSADAYCERCRRACAPMECMQQQTNSNEI